MQGEIKAIQHRLDCIAETLDELVIESSVYEEGSAEWHEIRERGMPLALEAVELFKKLRWLRKMTNVQVRKGNDDCCKDEC